MAYQYEVKYDVLKPDGNAYTSTDFVYCDSSYGLTFNIKGKTIERYNEGVCDTSWFYHGQKYTTYIKKNVLWDFGDNKTEEGINVKHSYEKPGTYTVKCLLTDLDGNTFENIYGATIYVAEPVRSELIKTYWDETAHNVGEIYKLGELEVKLGTNVIGSGDVVMENKGTGTSYYDVENPILDKYYGFFTCQRNEEYTRYKEKLVFEPVKQYSPMFQEIYGYYDKGVLKTACAIDDDLGNNIVLIKGDDGEYYDKYENSYSFKHFEEVRNESTNAKYRWLSGGFHLVYSPKEGDTTTINDQIIKYVNGKWMEYPSYTKEYTWPTGKTSFSINNISYTYREGIITKNEAEEKPDKVLILNKWLIFNETEVKNYYTVDKIPEEYHLIGKRGFVNIYFKNDIAAQDKVVAQFDLETSQFFDELESAKNYTNMNVVQFSYETQGSDWTDTCLSADGIIRELVCGVDEYLYYSFVPEEGDCFTIYELYYKELKHSVPQYYVNKSLTQEYTIKITSFNGDLYYTVDDEDSHIIGDTVKICGKTIPVIHRNEIVFPKQKLYDENIERMITALTPHPMFERSPHVRNFLISIFENNNWLKRTLTKITGFYDDNHNVDKCYIDKFVSLMQQMGEDTCGNDADFVDVNELYDLTRIISMNRSDLIGHEVSDGIDISFDGEYKGENLADEVKTDTTLYVLPKLGYVALGMEKDGSVKLYGLVAWEKFSQQSKVLPLGNIPTEEGLDVGIIKIGTNDNNWGWNLVLPEGQTDVSQYYRFFLLDYDKTTTHREGNFLNEDTITDITNGWTDDWKRAYQMLLLTLKDKLHK